MNVSQVIGDILRARYKPGRQQTPGKIDWPKHKVTEYVRLAIVKKEDVTSRDKHLDDLTLLTLQGNVDKILKKKEPLGDLKDIFHYNNEDCPRLILIMGGPGIGKTTLCHELCLRWARDGYLAEDFDAVVLILLRSLQQKSLKEGVVEHIGGEDNYDKLKRLQGRRCLIILEGFDEMAQQKDPFLLRLIKDNTVFEEATILITSRPHACEVIAADRRIEIVGFGYTEIEDFAKKSFPNDDQSGEFIRQLDEYPQLQSFCYIPMNLVMLVDIFLYSKDEKKKLPSTLTELYQLFTVRTLKRQVKKDIVDEKPAVCSSVAVTVPDHDKEILCELLRDLRDIPEKTVGELVGVVWCLSKLAYQGFFDWNTESKDRNPKIIFTESDLKQCDIKIINNFDGFGLLKATPTHGLHADDNIYSFNHLTIQEFFCAVYISLQFRQEQLHLLREHFHEYPNVFIFVCGLTGLASSEMFQFIYSKLTLPKESWRGDPDVITAIRCINESKQSSGPHQSVSPFTLDLTNNTLSPYDCVCVSHVLSCYEVLALKMNGCHIGNKGAELLVKHYPNSTGPLLEKLNLNDNDLTSEGMKHVIKIVRTSSATLRKLDVSWNDIRDDGMAVISEALQHNKSLTTLRVGKCGLSVKGAEHINQLLSITHTLQELNIGQNNIRDDGMEVISKALQHNESLTTLRVGWCRLSVKGAVYISQLLKVTHTLQELDMSDNDVSDDGIAVISEALQHNKSLTTLRVPWCGLSVKGAISISEMMMLNHSLQELIMWDNNIGDGGISAIAGALGNCKINKLDVRRCDITLIGATSLATALSSNHTIRKLWLWGNAITVEGALQIVKSAVNNIVCEDVRIDDKYKNDEVNKMMNILKDRRSQHESLQQPQITENNMENNNNLNNDKESGDGATVGLNEDVDHPGGLEKKREHHHKQASSSKQCCCLLL